MFLNKVHVYNVRSSFSQLSNNCTIYTSLRNESCISMACIRNTNYCIPIIYMTLWLIAKHFKDQMAVWSNTAWKLILTCTLGIFLWLGLLYASGNFIPRPQSNCQGMLVPTQACCVLEFAWNFDLPIISHSQGEPCFDY